MRKRGKKLLAAGLAFITAASMNMPAAYAQEVTPPEAYGPTPSDAQMKYYKEELAIFNHFGVNTYTNKEWGDGTEDPDIFNPVNLDTDQWIEAFKEAGFKRCLITAKHHDGFNLYPTSVTDHSVASSSWRDGQGDVLKDYYESCKKYDMGMGVYLSPWDQNLPSYSVDVPPDYNDTYVKQIEEIFENYSDPEHPIVEFWMDGACGDPETRPVYDIRRWWDKLEELNPDIVYQQNYGAPLRWVGNESGYASNTSWQTIDGQRLWDDYFVRGIEDSNYLHNGEPYIPGAENADDIVWSVPEVDVRIRSGWFYHANEEPKTPEELVKIYFDSVGLGSPLLLNVAPNREGLIDQKDIDSLMGFRDILDNTFDVNYAEGASAEATAVRGNHPDYAAENVTDNDYDTYWTMDDGQTTGSVTVELDEPVWMDVIEIQEYIPLGQRISSFTVDVRVNGEWMPYGEGGTIGYKRLVKGAPVMADAVRVNITGAYAVPLLNNVSVYKADSRIEEETMQVPGKIMAAEFQEKSGAVFAENKGPNGGSNIGGIQNGNYTVYKNVMFNQTPSKLKFTYGASGSPEITLRLDSLDGPILAQFQVEPTGDYIIYETKEYDIRYTEALSGYHDIYLCLNAGLNVASFEFTGSDILSFAEAEATVYEGGSVDVTVIRENPKQGESTSVTVTTEPDTAVHGRHFEHKQEVVTFGPDETEKTVTINTIDNDEKSGTLSFNVVLSDPSENAVLGSTTVEKIFIKDNDTIYTESNPLVLSSVPGEPVEVEAEMLMLTGLADTYEREGDSGGKEVINIGNNPDGEGAAELYFNAPVKGIYNFTVRFFTGAPGNVLKWSLNDGEGTAEDVPYTSEGGHFDELTIRVPVMQEGVNMIRFYNDEVGTCNLDKFTIARQAADMAWDMEEGSGSTITDSTGVYAGTMTGGISWDAGAHGSGLAFDGTGYIDLGMADLSQDWTVSAWVKRSGSVEDNAVLLAGSQGEIKIDQWENTGKVGLTEYGVADHVFNYSAPVGEWVQLTFVSDDRGTSLYVNGEFAETIQARINGPAARIGANTGDNLDSRGFYCGALDELKIFERSLTEEEIAALYTEPDQPEPSEPVSKKTLEYFLNSAKAHVANGDTEDCIQEVKDLFTEAIAEGEAVMADENATRDEVMDTSFKLMKAIHALNFKGADKTDLEMAVELAEMIDLDKYVEAGQKEFTDALAEAKDVLADGSAGQEKVDEAWDALVTAMENLRLRADKSVLEDLLNEAAGLDLGSYTEESAAAFRTALVSARAVFADLTLTAEDQQTVDVAVTALRQAKAGLVEKNAETGAEETEDPSDTKEPAETENPKESTAGNNGSAAGNNGSTVGNSSNTAGNNGNAGSGGNSGSAAKAAKTGDAAAMWAPVLMAIAAGVLAVAAGRKYRR